MRPCLERLSPRAPADHLDLCCFQAQTCRCCGAVQGVSERNVIEVRGANEHNLKNVDLDVPKRSLVVFTGPSGSGKSSLAFDTIYAEGQRRYVEFIGLRAAVFGADG